jgi:hypothetical protein
MIPFQISQEVFFDAVEDQKALLEEMVVHRFGRRQPGPEDIAVYIRLMRIALHQTEPFIYQRRGIVLLLVKN